MKLVLSFDERAVPATLQQVMAAAGVNTIVNVSSAHALNAAVLLQLAETAGNHKRLNASFNGAQLAGGGLHQFITASGASTRCNINTAQSTAISVLLDAIGLAGGSKNLSVEFNGAQLVSDNLQRSVVAAGSTTSIGVKSAHASDIGTLLRALEIVGDEKRFSANFNGAQLVGNNLQQVVAASGVSSLVIVNTAQSVAINVLLQLLGLAGGSKRFAVQFNGAQLVADHLQQVVAAAGVNTNISVNTAQATNIGTLLEVFRIVGDVKSLEVEFNGAQLQPDNLQKAVGAAGAKTSVGVNTAQAVAIDALIQIIGAVGNGKAFSADFNGAQLVSNNLQRAVNVSGANTTISVGDAQAVPVSTLLDIISAAG